VKRILMGFMLVTLLAATAGAASARTPRVDRRQARQNARIEQGVASGQLTPLEAARLKAGQRRVLRMELLAKADGVVTPVEYVLLRQAQNRQSREIFGLKHNLRSS
jgi:hypothetical protein